MSRTYARPLLSLFVGWWRVENQPIAPDVLVPLSYTTLKNQLTRGSRESLLLAKHYANVFPQAKLVISNSAHTGFPKCTEVEYAFKKALLDGTPHTLAGAQVNSITEAEAIKAALGVEPKEILVVCGEIHARSVRWIWRRVFPNTRITIRCIPYWAEYQTDHPFFIERYAWPWFFAGIARYLLLLIVGMQLRQWHHKARET